MVDEKTKDRDGVLSKKKKRIMIYFIEATEKLIEEEGIDGLSIRKIATEAGYNSATLYNYFEDLEHLILYASVRYLRDYIAELQKPLTRGMNALESYRVIYEIFSERVFHSPEIFYNMFFGHYSGKLNLVLQQYYQLFPDELVGHKGSTLNMLSQGNIFERDRAYMDSLVAEGFVKPEKKEATVQILVRTHQSFIAQACTEGGHLDIEKHKAHFMELFDYILEGAR